MKKTILKYAIRLAVWGLQNRSVRTWLLCRILRLGNAEKIMDALSRKSVLLLLSAVTLCVCTAGCQTYGKTEYHDITDANKAYAIPATTKNPGRGPYKSEELRDGFADILQTVSPTAKFSVF